MPKIAIIMGSKSDLDIMNKAHDFLTEQDIESEVIVASAHRNPEKVHKIAQDVEKNCDVVIAGAGMAAHLAGALKAHSTLPVIGVPLPGGVLDGLDSLFATVQMPKGVPVATMAVGKAGAINAAILCAEIFSLTDPSIKSKLDEFKNNGAKL